MIFEAVGFRQRLYKYKGTCSKALWFDLFTGQAQGFAIVKAVPSGNGYEALRQFGDCHASQQTQSRGLAMLASLTSWSTFQMGKPLHARLLKLEDGFEECRKTGVSIPDELETAIVFRCVSGALKTQLVFTVG